ncbi:MAG TPA: hypothetical protein DER07_10770, partial [Armatimonadetes bacterium]|nr:hypothetical protein [Armatimonadota bacterium]
MRPVRPAELGAGDRDGSDHCGRCGPGSAPAPQNRLKSSGSGRKRVLRIRLSCCKVMVAVVRTCRSAVGCLCRSIGGYPVKNRAFTLIELLVVIAIIA